MNRLIRLAATLLVLQFAGGCAAEPQLTKLRLPEGFAIELWATVPNARGLAIGAGSIVFVGSMSAGTVTAIPFDNAMRPKTPRVIARGLKLPLGVAWHDGSLFVSAVNRILRYDDIESKLDSPPIPREIASDLPGETHHGGRYIAFGPDGMLYIGIGAPCNICEPDPDRYALILRMAPDGRHREVFARGIRNTVGFDWDARTGKLWFSDNGRDWLGDDLPPDEINVATEPGEHFGYPYCHAGNLSDPEFGARRPCSDFRQPAVRLGAHVAPLGLRFIRGTQWPAAWQGRIIFAEHGSWNRNKKSGYRLMSAAVAGDRLIDLQEFAVGFLQGGDVWGRPVDLAQLPDGSLLVSDDLAGAIYRIRYIGAP